ncbi:transposase [Desulfitobacterium chlororespirans]
MRKPSHPKWIDPVSLSKIVFIQHLYGIRSMRQTIKDIEVTMAYR